MAGRRRKGEAPQMRRHKASGRAYVYHGGRHHYLGAWGSAAARREYAAWVVRWEAAEHAAESTPGFAVGSPGATVNELADAFLEWADRRYRKANGRPTGYASNLESALAPLVESCGSRSCDAVLGRDLLAVVEGWRAAGNVRRYVNQQLGRLKSVFRWGVSRGFVDESTAARLSLVQGLRLGEGREPDEVMPVPAEDVERTIAKLEADGYAELVAMLRVQESCGARPGEVCAMHVDELHRGSIRVAGRVVEVPAGLVAFAPTQHKTKSRGQFVCYVLGPRAQSVLAPWIAAATGGDGFLFRGSACNAGPHLSENYYGSVVRDTSAAVLGDAGRWTPNRLRHNFLTRWDAEVGIELGSAAVRHRSLATTAIYVQRDLSRVGPVAMRLG